jgi:hypothetical protein
LYFINNRLIVVEANKEVTPITQIIIAMNPQKPTIIGYTISILKIMVFVLAITIHFSSSAQPETRKAFPTAYGSASETTGGEGGVLVVVNTTNPNTPITYNANNNTWSGGFKDACNNATIGNSGRVIIFSVSGNIDLGGTNFDLYRHNVTILGQSAPEGGVTLHNGTFRLSSADNIIVRYLRCRNGLATQTEMNGSGNNSAAKSAGISVVNGCTKIIIDHVSASWGGDKAILLGSNGIYDQNEQTVQRCLLSDSHTMMQLSSQNTALYTTGLRGDLSCYLNMFARGGNRTPNIGGTGGYVDVINNVVQSDGSKLGVLQIILDAKVNWARNWTRFMGAGSSTANGNEFQMNYVDGAYRDDLQLYSRGNYYKNNSGVILDGTENIDKNDNLDIWSNRMGPSNIPQDTPMPENLFTVENEFNSIINKPPARTASEAYTSVVTERNAGACHYIKNDGTVGSYVDSWDSDLFTNLEAETMQEHGNVSNWILPSIPNNTRPVDFSTLGDGIEDNWRATNMSGQNYDDIAPSGYMWIEEFYNQVDYSGLVANAGVDQMICNGLQATLTATGGATYAWNTGETTASIDVSPINSTTYTVTVFDSTGTVSDTDDVTVNVTVTPIADAGENVETCLGTSVTLNASGGSGSATYQWSNSATTASILVNPNSTTTYTVQVSENNCSSTDQVTVTVNETPNVDAGQDQTIFDGESATLTATGADTYLWSTGETTQSIAVNPLLDTSYSVTGTTNTCENTDTVTVFLQDDSVNANAGADTEICIGESTILTATGGTTYLWSTGETTVSIDVSPTEITTYTVTVFSVSGANFEDDSVMVTVNDIPVADAGGDVAICFGNITTLSASGGTSYLWSTGEITQTITVNPTETTIYTVEVFENNCSSTNQAEVIVNPLPETNAGTNVTITEGESTTLIATGAGSYVWNTGETTSNITVSPLSTTTYTVIGTNSSGCESSDDVIVSLVADAVNASAGANVIICNGESTTLTATGGASYLWSTGQTTATIEVSPITTTVYSVTAFSANGTESDDDSVTVTVNEIPVADAGNDVAICFGNETTLSASGGTTYLWSTGETTQNITVIPNNTTTYTVEVFTNNCTSTDDIIITVTDLPETNAGSDITITEGDSTTLTATGAESYVWSTGETTSSILVNPTATVIYTVTGTSNGCESIDDVIITVETYTASAGADQTICQGYETTLTASEGDSYLWSTGETTQSITVNPTNTQTFLVTVFEGNSQADAEVEVGVNPNPNVVITNGDDVMILEGEFITLSATGANTYFWNNGATQPNIAVSPSNTTTYEVTGFINNCEETKAVIVNVLEIVQADAGEDIVICSEEIITLTANGGDEYLWSNGEATQSIEVSPNEDTEYSVLVYNALDSDEDSIMVFVEECSAVETPIESDTFDFLIYQDPTTDILNVRIDGLQSVLAKGYSIYDLTGKVIYTETFNPYEMEDLSQMTRELDVSMYSRGVYIVRLIYDDTSLNKKVPII